MGMLVSVLSQDRARHTGGIEVRWREVKHVLVLYTQGVTESISGSKVFAGGTARIWQAWLVVRKVGCAIVAWVGRRGSGTKGAFDQPVRGRRG